MATSRGVRVLIRFRPQSSIEDAKGGTLNTHIQHSPDTPDTEVAYGDPATTTAYNPPKRFTFDHIFQPKSAQDDVYTTVGKPAVDAVLEGYNGTILAYGQTGSGKTHTMLGPSGGSAELLASDQRGVVPRVLDDLLSRLQQFDTAEIAWTVQLSVLELYNEELFDLGPTDGSGVVANADDAGTTTATAGDLRIREDRTSGRGVYVEGLRCVSVKDAAQALDVIAGAARRKHTAGTQANETSSRSHTVVQLFVAQTNHAEGGTKTTAQLFLVDLAGSERIDKTGAAGQRLKEAQNINLSLTLLGNVINKLTDGKALHIPYRDSKLTRLLQDSLGGNSVTTLLCACSPSTFNASETLSTLQFANRAKKIENKPRANKVLSDDELRKAYNKALEEIRILSDRIHTLEGLDSREKGGGSSGIPAAATTAGGSGAKAAMAARKQQSSIEGEEDGSTDASLITELRETVASLSKELTDVREEVQAHDSTAEQLRTRVNFWVEKEKAAQEKAAEWKTKFDREKLACDSWARKFNGLVTTPSPGSARRSASSSASTAAGKPAAAGAGSFRRSKAAASGSSGAKKAATTATPAPPTPPSTDADDANTPEEREARALVRERMMLQQLDELREKLNVTHKYPIIIERLTKDLELLREESERKLERQVAESEALLQRQDDEIGRLQLKLDERQAQYQRESRGASGADTVGELARLKAENEILHEENRANAGRLIAFAKKGETLEKANAELVAERDRLRREIEASALTDAQKTRILGDALRAQKSNFRKRLLECFSRDED